MTYRKKLIEVSLPLEAINKEAVREKAIRRGHPSTLHLWWARRPLAACRAVLFASLVDDPSEYMTGSEEAIRAERDRLFSLLKDLAKWENSNDSELLDSARLEIARSVARSLELPEPVGKSAIRDFLVTKVPPVLDPFAGGGSIPLEAQRLGLRVYASDLNPVAVLINKALIEIPPKFANMRPVHPRETAESQPKQEDLWSEEWEGVAGLAEDLRYYGQWMCDEASARIGYLYPEALISEEELALHPSLKRQGMEVGSKLPVIAWLWARTVKCPNPACGAEMPLVRSFALSSKKGRNLGIQPRIDKHSNPPELTFDIAVGGEALPDGTVNRNGARCICCNTPVPLEYIRAEAKAGRMNARMMAVAAEGKKGRVYLPPIESQVEAAQKAIPDWFPDTELPEKALGFRVQAYGMQKHSQLFTARQLVALSTYSRLVGEVYQRIVDDTGESGRDYAAAVATYLGLAVSKTVNRSNTIATWKLTVECPGDMFTKQSVQMTWDFAESNVLSGPSGSFESMLSNTIAGLLSTSYVEAAPQALVSQQDAQEIALPEKALISTDPPYYDNIGYADLSDIFYVWLRKSLGAIYPELFRTMLVPKATELIASPHRFSGNREQANDFFEAGLNRVFEKISSNEDDRFPFTVFYAFKQSEKDDGEEDQDLLTSTGWETMLQALIGTGSMVCGTWPMRTERANRTVAMETNALASSIVLACRPRSKNATAIPRREFLTALKKELPLALRELQQGYIAPVDLAQAAIGPGMAIFSRYKAVLEADGSEMSVRTALSLINQTLDEFLAEQEGEYESDTRWALAWFEQFGQNEGAFGIAETLSKAKNTSVSGLVEAGILDARGGKVRLLRRDELDANWDPSQDTRLTTWEAVQHLIQALDKSGEQEAARLLARLGPIAESARDLSYRLFALCERKGWAQDALGYNMLVVAWPRLRELASSQAPAQGEMF